MKLVYKTQNGSFIEQTCYLTEELQSFMQTMQDIDAMLVSVTKLQEVSWLSTTQFTVMF